MIHKYYVSSTLIDYNSDSNTHQMSLKIFHDDLEKELGFQANELDYKDYENTNLILENYSVPSSYICPDQFKNEKLNINYTFIKDELASIKVTVSNDKNNTISNKLILMNYVKQTYGDFDTGTNPKIYNYFNSWKNGNKIIIYARLKDQFNIINEELFITNEKYKNKMKLINAMIEKGEIKG